MAYNKSDRDWVRQVPQNRFHGPYEVYGWEPGESILPEFRHLDAEYNDDESQGGNRARFSGESNAPGHQDWHIPGPYVGRGPRGYGRSDERITEEVCQRLTEAGQLDASDMEVEVSGGEVTLKGSVDSRRAKRLAEDIADTVTGVVDVHNQLRVRPPDSAGQGETKRESGMPGGRQGRVDDVGKSGVYPASGPLPPHNAEAHGMASWGQGERGAAGYEDHGTSEVWFTEEELDDSAETASKG